MNRWKDNWNNWEFVNTFEKSSAQKLFGLFEWYLSPSYTNGEIGELDKAVTHSTHWYSIGEV